MKRLHYNTIICVALFLFSNISFCQKIKIKGCENLEILDAVKKGLLNENLAGLDVNSQILACPKYFKGDPLLCNSTVINDEKWDPRLPNDLIWSLFFEKSQYEYCKIIFQDDFFVNSLLKVPEPSQEAIKWFEINWGSNYMLLPLNSKEEGYVEISELDDIQRKMITVFYHVRSWTFCPEKKMIDGSSTVHGKYDKNHNIVIYKTACQAKKIYKSDIKNLALVFKFHFIGAHELSHVIDDLNGSLNYESDKMRMQAEKRANINGLIITKALCKLFNAHFAVYKVKVYENLSVAKPCDLSFINNLVNDWMNVEDFFEKEIKISKKKFSRKVTVMKMNKEEWSTWGCIEKN